MSLQTWIHSCHIPADVVQLAKICRILEENQVNIRKIEFIQGWKNNQQAFLKLEMDYRGEASHQQLFFEQLKARFPSVL